MFVERRSVASVAAESSASVVSEEMGWNRVGPFGTSPSKFGESEFLSSA